MKCKYCGGEFTPKHKGDKHHQDIYDCCDVVNPNWMKEWLVRMNKKKEPYVSDFCKWSRSVIVSSVLLLFGCEWLDEQLTVQDLYNPDDYEIELYMKTEMVNNIYQIDYPNSSPHSYISVYYEVTPPIMQRVFWSSPDSFTVIHQGYPITQSIINYSTYSKDDGTGKQLIYLNNTMVGKTLSIYGCVSEGDNGCEVLVFDVF